MVATVTENARQELKKKLIAHADDPEIGIRLEAIPPDQVHLVLSREREGDQVIEYDGFKVLLVGKDIAEPLRGITIDVRDTPDGPKLSVLRK